MERTNFAFCGRSGVVGLRLRRPHFSNSPISKDYRAHLQTVMTKYCARVWGVASLRTAGSSKGTILLLPDRLRPRSTAKSRPNLSGKGP